MELSIVDKCISLVAKRNSGKSYLLRYLVLTEKENFDKIFVICPTERINKFYSGFVPEKDVFDSYEEEWVEKLIATLTKVNSGKPKSEYKRVLLIMDDCIADTNMHASPTLKKLYSRGRHLGVSLVVTTQHLTGISPLMRTNSDFLLAGQMNRASVELLCSEFLSGDIDKAEFIKMYNRLTSDYGFLVVNCTSVKESGDINAIYGRVRTPAEYMD